MLRVTGLASALRSARLPVNLIGIPINYANRLIGTPINYANRLIGSPITSQSTGPQARETVL